MNREDLINKVSEDAAITKKAAEAAVAAIFGSAKAPGAIESALAAGDKLQLVGFGTFEAKARAARKGRNPHTGEPIDIPASKIPHFKAGNTLKARV